MSNEKPTRGGVRPGAGRKATTRRNKSVTVYLTQEHHEWLSTKSNKSEYIATLIDRDMDK